VPQASVHSFVLRIWLEESREEDGRTLWRGHVTDIATGERRHVQDIDGIVAFLIPRLAAMGATVGIRWRVHSWLASLPSPRPSHE